MSAPSRKIENQAESLLWEVFSNIRNIVPPIDIFQIAKYQQITVHMAEFDNSSHIAALDRVKRIIYISEKEPVHIQRFCLAKNLGHLEIHKEDVYVTQPNDIFYAHDTKAPTVDMPPEDIESNDFALALLMPEELFNFFWTSWKNSMVMARLFDVSPTMVQWRLHSLGLSDRLK